MERHLPGYRRPGALLPRRPDLHGEHAALPLASPLPHGLLPRGALRAPEVAVVLSLRYQVDNTIQLFLPQGILFLQCRGQPVHRDYDLHWALLSVFLQRLQTGWSHGHYGLQNAGPGHCQVGGSAPAKQIFLLENITGNKSLIFQFLDPDLDLSSSFS